MAFRHVDVSVIDKPITIWLGKSNSKFLSLSLPYPNMVKRNFKETNLHSVIFPLNLIVQYNSLFASVLIWCHWIKFTWDVHSSLNEHHLRIALCRPVFNSLSNQFQTHLDRSDRWPVAIKRGDIAFKKFNLKRKRIMKENISSYSFETEYLKKKIIKQKTEMLSARNHCRANFCTIVSYIPKIWV